jgi:hypothetical protein
LQFLLTSLTIHSCFHCMYSCFFVSFICFLTKMHCTELPQFACYHIYKFSFNFSWHVHVA